MILKQSLFVLKSFYFQGLLRFLSFLIRFKPINFCVIASSLLLGGTLVLVAQTPPRLKRLPPPPLPGSNRSIPPATARPPSMAPIALPTPQVSNAVVREYTFQAPQTPPLRSRQSRPAQVKLSPFKPAQVKPIKTNINQKNNPVVLSSPANSRSTIYRVEIPGTDETLLARVRSVEPLAVIWNRQGVIYGGIFPQQKLAQERVNQLQKKGVLSKIVPLSRSK